jgi:hypothetical protein
MRGVDSGVIRSAAGACAGEISAFAKAIVSFQKVGDNGRAGQRTPHMVLIAPECNASHAAHPDRPKRPNPPTITTISPRPFVPRPPARIDDGDSPD